jgi:DNA modification methylase
LALLEQLIRSGSRPEDLVLDPFMGSGSTAVAAEGLGRRWLGIEKRRDYVVMAAERVAGMVG